MVEIKPEARRARRGNAMITAVSFLTLTGFAALAIDLGYAWTADSHLQAIGDAAAIGAVPYIDGTATGVADAETAAMWIASQNAIFGTTISLTEEQVETGIYESETGVFVASTEPVLVNAIRVNASLSGLEAFFGGFSFGAGPLQARTMSLAVRPPQVPAGTVDCYLPVALPACLLDTYTDAELADMEFKLQPANADNLGWARPADPSSTDDHPSSSWISSQFQDCQASGELSIGAGVNLDNGAKQSALATVGQSIEAAYDAGEVWDESKWNTQPAQMAGSAVAPGKYSGVVQGPIMLFGDCPDENDEDEMDTDTSDDEDPVSTYCDSDGGSWTGTMCVTDFAWAAVYDSKTSEDASQRNIKVRLDTQNEYEFGSSSGGGSSTNVTYQPPPALVY